MHGGPQEMAVRLFSKLPDESKRKENEHNYSSSLKFFFIKYIEGEGIDAFCLPECLSMCLLVCLSEPRDKSRTTALLV